MVFDEIEVIYEELSFQHITQEPQELQRYNRGCRFIGKSAVINNHQLLSKVTSINRKSLFDQLATASSSTHS